MLRVHVSAVPPSSQGAAANYKDPAGEPVDHALGKSRGGWTTKIHTLTDAHTCPVTLLLGPGQGGDNPQLMPLLAVHARRRPGRFRLLADKAYSHPSTRHGLRTRGIPHTIPERSDQIQQ